MSGSKDWRTLAEEQQLVFYQSFGNQRFQEYESNRSGHLLLRAKVNYALFGLPQKEVEKIEDAYNDDQNKASDAIVQNIIDAYMKLPGNRLCVSFIFIICCTEKEKKVFRQPLFAVSGDGVAVKYVDTVGRTYGSWVDFKDNNKFEKMEYCLPWNGYYSCEYGKFEYDEKKEPKLEFSHSPASEFWHKTVDVADITTAVVGLGAGALAIASMLTPVGWVAAAATYAGVGGMGAAVYGGVRAVYQIVDKALHDENMLSLDSFMLYGSVALTPLNFMASFTSAKLAQQAVRGSIGSVTLRSMVTILSVTTLTLDGTMVVFGFINLLDKKKQGTLGPLDLVQFSMSVFFFGHTLIQPKTAGQVIQRAQSDHIGSMSNQVSSAEAKAAFEKFVKDNGGDVKKTSNVIRTLNRIDNPDAFFKQNRNAAEIKVGGRKGRTVIVKDQNGIANRINPNKIVQTEGYKEFEFKNKIRNKIEAALGGVKMEEFEVNREPIFANLSEHELRRLETTIGTIKKDPELVAVTKKVCVDMNVRTADEFISMLEIVQAHVSEDRVKGLGNLSTSPGRSEFISVLNNQLEIAKGIAKENLLSFKNEMMAVYHFRKHGKEFCNGVPSIECYLRNIPQKMYQDANLTSCHSMGDGRVRKSYIKPNGTFMVVQETSGVPTICTIFSQGKKWSEYVKQWRENQVVDVSLWTCVVDRFENFGVHPTFFLADHEEKTESPEALTPIVVELLKSTSLNELLCYYD